MNSKPLDDRTQSVEISGKQSPRGSIPEPGIMKPQSVGMNDSAFDSVEF